MPSCRRALDPFSFVYDMTTYEHQQTVRLISLLGRRLAVAVMGLAACGMQLQGQWLLRSHCLAAAAALGALRIPQPDIFAA